MLQYVNTDLHVSFSLGCAGGALFCVRKEGGGGITTFSASGLHLH
jgi:hypothetical protein